MNKFPESGRQSDFLGHLKITTDEAVSLCEKSLRRLGYKEKLPAPIIAYAPARGSLVCTRYT